MNIQEFIRTSISGQLSLEAQKTFLLELNKTGFTGADIAEMVRLFYAEMPVQLELPGAVDLCGTGGSGLARINTSTINSIVLAACGVPVAKHGNKAASGRFGSFDLLESMGVNIMADKDRLERLYDKLGIAFIFARSFHPAFKHFGQVRQELGVKTIFNILGPLLNPAQPAYQIIGTSNPGDMQLIADACVSLGKKHALVVNGSDGLDEFTLSGSTSVIEILNGKIKTYKLSPEDFGFETVDFSKIAGGSEKFNVRITNDILNGECQSEHLNLVLANVALSLKFMGKVSSYAEGVDKARQVIDSGQAKQKLEQYRQLSQAPDILLEITANKEAEIAALKKALPLKTFKAGLKNSERDFRGAISKPDTLNLIAEIKKGSPSQAIIYQGELNAGAMAQVYEKNGADGISVLTDEKYFKGSLDNLKAARNATSNTPLLMKDFFIDPYQIYLARHYGADAILLIVAILTETQVKEFSETARSLGMDCLVEVHNERELKIAQRAGCEIIGINNRDLHSMKVDPKHFLRLSRKISHDRIIVAESGYELNTVSRIKGLANAVLVGTAIMRESDIPKAIQKIKKGDRQFKACGIRTREDAAFCEEAGVDMVGLNFVPSSKRCIDMRTGRDLVSELRETTIVGVFQDQEVEEVNRIAMELELDFVQLSGNESVDCCRQVEAHIIKTITIDKLPLLKAYEEVASMFIIDGSMPGSGKGYDYSSLNRIKTKTPFLVAGGISKSNVASVLSTLGSAWGVDVASGLESDGVVNQSLITDILKTVKKF